MKSKFKSLIAILCAIVLSFAVGCNQGGHTHDYKTLKFDETHHWYECDCGSVKDKGEHSGGTATMFERAKCSVCNTEYGSLLSIGEITVDDIAIGELLALDKSVSGQRGEWIVQDVNAPLITNDILDLTIGEIKSFGSMSIDQIIVTLLKNRTVGDYLEDFGVTLPSAFDELAETELNELIERLSVDPLAYLQGLFGDKMLGEFIPGYVYEDGKWSNGVREPKNSLVANMFSTKVNDIIEGIQTGRIDRFIERNFGDNKIFEILDLIVEVKVGVNERGYQVCYITDEPLPLLISDILDVCVSDIIDATESEDIVKELSSTIFGDRIVADYVDDLAITNFEGDVYSNIMKTKVVDLIDGLRRDPYAYIMDLTEGFRLGDIAHVVFERVYYEDQWLIANQTAEDYMQTLFEVTVQEITEWAKNGELSAQLTTLFEDRTVGDYLAPIGVKVENISAVADMDAYAFNELLKNGAIDDYVTIFGEISFGDVVSAFVPAFGTVMDSQMAPQIARDGDRWTIDGNPVTLFVGDLFDVTVSDVCDWSQSADKVSAIMEDIFGYRTLEEYLIDFGVDWIIGAEALRPIMQYYTITEHVASIRQDIVAHLRDLFKDAYVGDILGIALEIEGNGDEWYLNGNLIKRTLCPILNIQIEDIISWFDGHGNKVEEIAHDIFGVFTVEEFLVDFGLDSFNFEAFRSITSERIMTLMQVILHKETGTMMAMVEPIKVGEIMKLFVPVRENSIYNELYQMTVEEIIEEINQGKNPFLRVVESVITSYFSGNIPA